MIPVSGAPRAPIVIQSDLLSKPVAVSARCFAASSCHSPLRSAAQVGPPRLALYSLTESARFSFHAEPAHSKLDTVTASKSSITKRSKIANVVVSVLRPKFLVVWRAAVGRAILPG